MKIETLYSFSEDEDVSALMMDALDIIGDMSIRVDTEVGNYTLAPFADQLADIADTDTPISHTKLFYLEVGEDTSELVSCNISIRKNPTVECTEFINTFMGVL